MGCNTKSFIKKQGKNLTEFIPSRGKILFRKNDLNLSCEPNSGNGSLGFKISRGMDKTIIEVKLSTNAQYLHGYETQVKQYSKAEQKDKMIYVFIDLGNHVRRKTLIEEYKKIKEMVLYFLSLLSLIQYQKNQQVHLILLILKIVPKK